MNDVTSKMLDLTIGRQDEEDEQEDLSPLAVTQCKDLALGWIDLYADLMTKLTGAPREFNQLAGIVTAATAIQRKARLRMTFGDIYPNIFACIIAPSSVYHKSSVMQKPRLLFNRAMLDKLQLSELMTSEGLLKQLQSQSAGVILRDEIGTLFDSHNTKYLRTLKPDLTAIYDCYPYSRRLSNDEIKVEKPYLNILGATTPTRFFEGITYTDWRDGFLARWLFVQPEGEPDFDAMTGLFQDRHEAELQRLSFKLLEIDRHPETDFTLQDEALQLWDAWQKKNAKAAYIFGDDVTAAIVTRYSAYALKFALILSAVNDSWGTITKGVMRTAITLSDNYKTYVHNILKERQNFGISGAKIQRTFNAIVTISREAGHATTKRIMQRTGLKKAELAPCLEKLIEIGAIDTEQSGNGSRYTNNGDRLPFKTW